MNNVTVYGNMDWFSVAEQPDSMVSLPAEFSEAKSLWEQNDGQCTNDIIAKLQQYVTATFVADNLDGWQDYISEKNYGEFIATKVRVVGLDFKESPIPLCKAEAWFNVPLKEGVSAESLQSWVDDELDGALYAAISFSWVIEGEELEDLDLTFGDHAGAESIIESNTPL